MEPLIIVSADSHASAPPEVMREYFDPDQRRLVDALIAENEEYLAKVPPILEFPAETLEFIDPEQAIRSGGWIGAYEVETRLKEMDREGIAAEVIFASTQYATTPFFGPGNRPHAADVRAAGTRAYHRWLTDVMTAADGRLIGVAESGPCLDMDETLRELENVATSGFRAVFVPGAIPDDDLPPLMDPYFERFWAACADLDLVLAVHAGHGQPQGAMLMFVDMLYQMASTQEEVMDLLNNAKDSVFALDPLPRRVLWQLMLGGIFDRFPSLRLTMTEVRADWVPPTLAHLDRRFEAGELPMKARPSEYWERHCLSGVSSIHRAEVDLRHKIGVERMMFGRDYPHPEGTWPNTADWIFDAFAGIPEDELRLILGGNAIRCYGLDRDRLAGIAARVGPTVSEIMDRPERIEDRCIEHFHNRAGYLREAESVDFETIDSLLYHDLATLGTGR